MVAPDSGFNQEIEVTQGVYRVGTVEEAGDNIFILRFRAADLSPQVKPGQFINLKVSDTFIPLLRRPFSVYRVDGAWIEIIFNVIGVGTRILASKTNHDTLDVLGPLGTSYSADGDFTHAVLVAGGLGVAPLPLLTSELRKKGKRVTTLLGARNVSQIVPRHLESVSVATDDGSSGHHGTVVDLLRTKLTDRRAAPGGTLRIFACGPTPMLRALAELASERSIGCELSLEGPMACGIGICQGCPVALRGGAKKYALICRDGTVFNSSMVSI